MALNQSYDSWCRPFLWELSRQFQSNSRPLFGTFLERLCVHFRVVLDAFPRFFFFLLYREDLKELGPVFLYSFQGNSIEILRLYRINFRRDLVILITLRPLSKSFLKQF